MHPTKEQCSSKVIHAHSISNKKILTPLSENGNLIKFNDFIQPKKGVKTDGRNSFSTFTGFCDSHDKIFAPIDEESFDLENRKHIFLMNYRTLAYSLRSFEENIRGETILFNQMLEGSTKEFIRTCILPKKPLFNTFSDDYSTLSGLLLKEEYDSFYTFPIELNETIELTACSCIYWYDRDFLGVPTGYDRKTLFFNVFPDYEKNKTYIIFSCIKEDVHSFIKLFSDLYKMILNDKEMLFCFLTNLLFHECENYALSPRLWDSFTIEEKNSTIDYHLKIKFLQMVDSSISLYSLLKHYSERLMKS